MTRRPREVDGLGRPDRQRTQYASGRRRRQDLLRARTASTACRLFYRTDLVKEAGFDGPPTSWDDLLEQASAIQDPSKNQSTATPSAAARTRTATWSRPSRRYASTTSTSTNAFKTEGRHDDLRRTGGARTPSDDYFELFKEASPPSSVVVGLPRDGRRLHQRLHRVPAAGPGGHRDRAATSIAHRGPVGAPLRCSSAPSARPRSRWPSPAGASPRRASTRRPRSSSSSSSPRPSPPPVRPGEQPRADHQEAADDEFYKTGPWTSYVTMTEDPDTYVNVAPAARRPAGGPSGSRSPTRRSSRC